MVGWRSTLRGVLSTSKMGAAASEDSRILVIASTDVIAIFGQALIRHESGMPEKLLTEAANQMNLRYSEPHFIFVCDQFNFIRIAAS